MRISRLLFTLSLVAITTGCAVGPDFERPAAPDVASYDDTAPLHTIKGDDTYGAAQNLSASTPLSGDWWTSFKSQPLNDMVAVALKHNPDLAAAEASLRAANEDLAAGEGELFPTVTGDFSSTRQKTSGASYGGASLPGSIYTLHNASVSVSYGIDLFGGTRRAVENLEATRDYQGFELEAAKLSVAANVVTSAIREASLRGQIKATETLIQEEQKQLDIEKNQLKAGAITRLTVLTQETTLAQTRASLPPLEQQLATTRHALSVLTGELPTHAPKQSFELNALHLPETLPLTLPSRLVEQRPDIRAAEENLHAASAAIGVAEAKRLPELTLSADIGSVANQLGKLFSPGGGIWSLGGGLSETIFDAGTLAHEQGSAEAKFDVAAAQYRKTVLTAFQDVADTLRALESDAKTLQAQSEAERASADSLKLARDQYQAGAISFTALLDVENAEQKSRIALVQAEAQRFADTAALYQALGGGWNTPISAMQASTTKDTP